MANPKRAASSAPAKPRKLTPQREYFCSLVVTGYSAAAAYRMAYVVADDTKPATVWNNAYMLQRVPEVAARIAQLRDEANRRAVVSREGMLVELEENRTIALEQGRISAANSASIGRARVAGYMRPPAPPPPQHNDDAMHQVADAAMDSAVERSLFDIGRKVLFTLELGRRKAREAKKVEQLPAAK